ncbi:MAG: NAD(P)-binding protein, partial [Acetobacteraceae bacterium]|nr:NAD(P)-binding protein [Acetobacteraceae bacterium]
MPRTPPSLLQIGPWAGHVAASTLNRLIRRDPNALPGRAAARLKHFAASWPEALAGREPRLELGMIRPAWPHFPVHGRGIYEASVAVLLLDTALVQTMLPPPLELGSGLESKHPVVFFFGRQDDVRPSVWPLPGWNYDEAVIAVPDVYACEMGYAYEGPFAYLPRLWLDRLPPVLAGLFLYGYAKQLAQIRARSGQYTITGFDDSQLLAEARFTPQGAGRPPHTCPGWSSIERLLNQPLLAEPMPGVEIGSVLSFRLHKVRTVAPITADLTLAPEAAPNFRGGTYSASGLDSLPAAFQMTSHWHLTPPLPREWIEVRSTRSQRPRSDQPAQRANLRWNLPPKRKIAILGGGTGSLCAAWALTQSPDWQDLYDITVYQMGWRLGGKGASGRNAKFGQRIEEHGLHVWAGFYENAFRIMRNCYAQLGRPPGSPLATIDDAFKPHSLVTLEDNTGGTWKSWNIDTWRNAATPGEGDPFVPAHPHQYLPELLAGMIALLPHASPRLQSALATHPARRRLTTRAAVAAAQPALRAPRHPTLRARATEANELFRDTGGTVLHDAHALAQHAARLGPLSPMQILQVWRLIRALRADQVLHPDLEISDDDFRRIAQLLDLGLATITGMITDGLIFRGFAAADGEEWRDWLRRHGAHVSTLSSPAVRATYDYVFGFAGGNTNRPALAAGTTTHGLMRLMLTYKGALFWTMQAGMGDTVFTPLYRVLRQRGVAFEFFHKVESLSLSEDGSRIERIHITRQAALADPAKPYEPLVPVRDLDCWPSEPRFEQLEQGEKLRASGADLEHDPSPISAGPVTLEQGRDLDQIILGISLGALGPICSELVRASPRWRSLLDEVKTVATAGVQLWFQPDLVGLGWKGGRTIATAYAEPLDTWADLNWLLAREDWAGPDRPASVVYLCGPLTGAGPALPVITREWLLANAHHLWPNFSP